MNEKKTLTKAIEDYNLVKDYSQKLETIAKEYDFCSGAFLKDFFELLLRRIELVGTSSKVIEHHLHEVLTEVRENRSTSLDDPSDYKMLRAIKLLKEKIDVYMDNEGTSLEDILKMSSKELYQAAVKYEEDENIKFFLAVALGIIEA